jgi:hypothetical protein
MQADRAEREHPLCSVEKAEALFGAEANGCQAVPGQDCGGRLHPIPVFQEAFSDDRECEMSERSEVTRRPDRAL